MRSAISAQERPARNVPTAGFNCARIMWKHVADATRSSAPAFSSVQRSTPKLHRQTTGKFENERPPIPHPASQPLKVKGFQPLTGHLRDRLIALLLSTSPGTARSWALRTHTESGRSLLTSDSLESLPWSECRMQKNLRLDWLLWGSIAMLAFSVLGFAYILLQTYITVSR